MKPSSSNKDLAAAARRRYKKQALAQREWELLDDQAAQLIHVKLLSLDVRRDPCVWLWASSQWQWAPVSNDLVKELEEEDARAPERSFYVDSKRAHPFFEDRLHQNYPNK